MRLKKHLHYAAEAKWNHMTGGTAKLDGFTQPFDTPREYDGNEAAPCPDQLFTASLAGCIINTFNYYRRMLDAETITGIDIDIHVWSDPENHELNQRCAQRATEYCHLTKSIEQAIPTTTKITLHIE